MLTRRAGAVVNGESTAVSGGERRLIMNLIIVDNEAGEADSFRKSNWLSSEYLKIYTGTQAHTHFFFLSLSLFRERNALLPPFRYP